MTPHPALVPPQAAPTTTPAADSPAEDAPAALAARLLGAPVPPLTVGAMARALEVTFFPPHERSATLDAFTSALADALREAGATVTPYEAALGESGKVRPDVVVIEQGEGPDGGLAIHHVSSLYRNPLVAVYERPCPVGPDAPLQEGLDAIVGVLAWNLTHTPIFVHEGTWTVCTMNGAVIRCGSAAEVAQAVREALVPKLSAQVKPPDPSTLDIVPGGLDVQAEGLAHHADDMMAAARVWARSGLMLAHTSIDDLAYRSRFYRRIVAAYLDHRTGMSYGFMARQLPVDVPAARRAEGAEPVPGWARLTLGGETWLVPTPEVQVLGTRSGCEKTNLDPATDLVRLRLAHGRIALDTPAGTDPTHCRPSYDTLAILAHAAGNAVAASLLRAHDPDDLFATTLATDGLSLSHWHAYPEGAPPHHTLHGEANPPVSCSTPQSAVYAFAGKLDALAPRLGTATPYHGDVHVEPHHGTNVTGVLSLEDVALWAEAQDAKE